MTLSRIVLAVDGGKCSLFRPQWLTRIFVSGDVFSFIVQASGAGLRVQAGTGNSTINPNLGAWVIVGGLVFQIVIFGVFIAAALVFHRRFLAVAGSGVVNGVPWQGSIYMLYVTSAVVMTRNVFRVVEYAMGHDGYLLGVEWGVYVFDAALMTVTMGWFLWRYPSQLKPALKARNSSGEDGVAFDQVQSERK